MKRYGLAWPAHRQDVSKKDIVDFQMATRSATMPKGSGIILDIKDIHGRIFYPSKIKRLASSVSESQLAFHELRNFAARSEQELFLGLPVLQDAARAKTELSMIRASGEPEGTFLCPRNPAVRDLNIELINELAEAAPEVKIFLPFFRFPIKRTPIDCTGSGRGDVLFSITEDDACCFCQHCMALFKSDYGAQLSFKRLSSEPRAFYDWLEWRCRSIEHLATSLACDTPRERLVMEIDLCPKRHYLDGLFIENGHDIPKLSKIFDHILIHILDRSVPLPPYKPGTDILNDILFMNVEKIKRDAEVYTMMWGIRTDVELGAAYEYSNSLDVNIRFFVLYPDMAARLIERCSES